jgi:hypothetical protein
VRIFVSKTASPIQRHIQEILFKNTHVSF